ncbi:MAG: hypothetical protein H6907_12625 [Hyphomicrobiales bacterium]|nr:hypothetical protein [Hyphomicrobiales bacterium]MCP5372567.1 hypothetical protein [Hyphomicrobiales bacterium]
MGDHLIRRLGPLGAVAAVALAAALAAGPAGAAKTLVKHLDLKVMMPDDFACAERIKLYVVAPSAQAFQGNRRPLQRVIGGARASLGFVCDQVQIEDAVLYGVVGRDIVWRGIVSRKNNWVLVDLPMEQPSNGGGGGGGSSGGGGDGQQQRKPPPDDGRTQTAQNQTQQTTQKAEGPTRQLPVEPNFGTALVEPPVAAYLP